MAIVYEPCLGVATTFWTVDELRDVTDQVDSDSVSVIVLVVCRGHGGRFVSGLAAPKTEI